MADLVKALRECPEYEELTRDAADEIERLREEVDERQKSFDLRWNADMRAIKRWRGNDPKKELKWPDHADLCVWLLEKLDRIGELMKTKSPDALLYEIKQVLDE